MSPEHRVDTGKYIVTEAVHSDITYCDYKKPVNIWDISFM